MRAVLLPAIAATVLTLAAQAVAQTPAPRSIGAVREVIVYAYGTPAALPRRALFVPSPVFAEERVETVANGGLALLFADDTQFRVGPASLVTLDRFVFDPDAGLGAMALSLTKGTFRYISGKMPGESVQLRTPSALIGIRGTDFFVTVLASGATLIHVVSGLVTVQALTGGAASTAVRGDAVTVNTDGTMQTAAGVSPPSDPALDPGANPGAENLPGGSGENASSSSSSSSSPSSSSSN